MDIMENLPKQKHTAKRIYDRLMEELQYTGSESTVRKKVKELKEYISQLNTRLYEMRMILCFTDGFSLRREIL